MRPSLSTRKLVPSNTLLRFLRTQSEEACFFTSNSSVPRPSSEPAAPSFPQRPLSLRHITTTHRRRASVQSSLLSFDFLRPAPTTKSVEPLIRSSEFPSRQCFRPGFIHDSIRRSSTERRHVFGRWWNQDNQGDRSTIRPTDLPPLPNFLDEVGNSGFGGRGKVAKPGNELKLRCTEIDENGKVTTVNGEFKKSELIAKVSLIFLSHVDIVSIC